MYEFEFEEDKIEAFRDASIVTKSSLLSSIRTRLRWLEMDEESDEFKFHSAAFRRLYLDIMRRFYEKVEKTKLFDELEPWWCYQYTMDDTGASLHLQYVEDADFDDDMNLDCVFLKEDFELVKVSTRLLTVEEYAGVYGVEVGTVRQWIRRGKIRSAVKAGSEWRIPELSEITGRGYRRATFHWDEKLYNVPEEYSYISNYDWISIDQNIQDRNLYRVVLRGKGIKSKEIIMETKDREKFELYLISNPLIKPTSETFGNYG